MSSSKHQPRTSLARAWAISVFMAVAAFCVVWFGLAVRLDPSRQQVSWFSLDNDQYLAMIDDRHFEGHETSGRHPLISILMVVPVWAMELAGADRPTALRIWVSAVGSLWIVAAWSALRLATDKVAAVAVLTLATAASAPYLFYAATFESFGLSGLGVAVSLSAAQAAFMLVERRKQIAHVVAVAAPMAVTVTLAIVGFLGVWADAGLRRAGKVLLRAYVLMTFAFALQSSLFSESRFFLSAGGHRTQVNFLNPEQWVWNVFHWTTSLFVAPHARAELRSGVVFVEPELAFGAAGGGLAIAWLAVLSIGILKLARQRAQTDVMLLAVLSFLAVQVAAFGNEPFLQTPFAVVPATLVVARAWPTSTRASAIAAVGMLTLVGLTAAWNVSVFDTAVHLLSLVGPQG